MPSRALNRSPFHFPIRRPVTVTMVVVTSLVFGGLSYRLLPINLMPEISYPSITVRTEYPGAAPEEVETVVTRPLEQSLGIVRNLVEMTSSSRAEYSDIVLEYNWEADMNQATQEVREKLDLSFLPDDIKPPLILRYDPSLDPLMRIALTSDSLTARELRDWAEDLIKRELEKLPDVAAVKPLGGEESEIKAALNLAQLDLLNIPLELINSRLASENINLAGGRLREGRSEFIIRTLNEFQTESDIADIVLKEQGGRLIRLSDVADVYRCSKKVTSITRVSGRPSVELEIYKESGANPIIVSDLVKKRLLGDPKKKFDRERSPSKSRNKPLPPRRAESLSETLAGQLKIQIIGDQAQFIRMSVAEVKSAVLVGGVLAVVVLFLFLGSVPNTLAVAIVIPISLICAFAAMHLFKVTLNVMSLGGLALGVGMMVDNAIVVLESIHRRLEAGEDGITASVRGTDIVGGAVTASTLTTVVVFFPIVFVTGIAGQIFGDMALTVIIALSVSLIVALFFLPMLIARLHPEAGVHSHQESLPPVKLSIKAPGQAFLADGRRWRELPKALKWLSAPIVFPYLILRLIIGGLLTVMGIVILWLAGIARRFILLVKPKLQAGVRSPAARLGAQFQRGYKGFSELYIRLLKGALRYPAGVLLAFFVVGLISFGGLLPRLGGVLIPNVNQGVFDLEFSLPVGTPVETTALVVAPLERALLARTEIASVSCRTGGDPNRAEVRSRGSHNAVVNVVLKPHTDLRTIEERITDFAREWASAQPSLEMTVTHPTLFSFKKPIEVILKQDDLNKLKLLSNKAVQALSRTEGLMDVESTVQPGHPEVSLKFDRNRLALLGLTPLNAAERVQTAILGKVSTKFREEAKRIDIRVQLAEADRTSLDDLKRLIINPGQPTPVTLSEVAAFHLAEGPAEINRLNGVRIARLSADVKGIDLKEADSNIKRTLSEIGLIEGVDYQVLGQRREMDEALTNLRLALLLAVFLVYVVMASQFESLRYPFLILMTVPFALAGVIPALFLLDMPLSVIVFLGFIVLAGVVVNNSIVLIDYMNQLRAQGLEFTEAIIASARARLRPILMTSLTTILALIPMAWSRGEGAELRQPLAVTIIFGLSLGTMITLILIPSLVKLININQRIKPIQQITESDEPQLSI